MNSNKNFTIFLAEARGSPYNGSDSSVPGFTAASKVTAWRPTKGNMPSGFTAAKVNCYIKENNHVGEI